MSPKEARFPSLQRIPTVDRGKPIWTAAGLCINLEGGKGVRAPWQRVIALFMLKKLGVVMLALWLLESASHRPLPSWVHLLSIMACISFVAEFVRSRVVAARGSREQGLPEAAPVVSEAPRPLTSNSGTSLTAG